MIIILGRADLISRANILDIAFLSPIINNVVS